MSGHSNLDDKLQWRYTISKCSIFSDMKNYLITTFLSALAPMAMLEQDTIPHIQGKVNI